MYYVEKTHTWKDNWNDIIRYVFFKDEKLRDLMLIPDGISITQFIDKYFVEDVVAGEILTDEKVRVVYYDSDGRDTGNKNVLNRYKEFDIYVRDEVLHNATKDRLQNRYDLIAERIKYLLLKDRNIYNLRFSFYDSYNLWTKTNQYRRYHLVFSYKTTV